MCEIWHTPEARIAYVAIAASTGGFSLTWARREWRVFFAQARDKFHKTVAAAHVLRIGCCCHHRLQPVHSRALARLGTLSAVGGVPSRRKRTDHEPNPQIPR
jgi:hypothetical protein